MNFISVGNLDKYQHYKGKNMVWIKWYLDCMQDYHFTMLTDEDKWLFMGLVMLAVKCENKIPDDPGWIAKQISSRSKIENSIETLAKNNLITLSRQSPDIVSSDGHPIDKIREEKIREEKTERPCGLFNNVFLTDTEKQTLAVKWGKTKLNDWIETLSSYMEGNGKRYKSHYATILNWERRNPKPVNPDDFRPQDMQSAEEKQAHADYEKLSSAEKEDREKRKIDMLNQVQALKNKKKEI